MEAATGRALATRLVPALPGLAGRLASPAAAPFLSEESLSESLPHLVDAVAPGGWLVAGTNPAPSGELAAAVARWNASRDGGSTVDAGRMVTTLRELGLSCVDQRPTVPGGPILVVGQCPYGSRSPESDQ